MPKPAKATDPSQPRRSGAHLPPKEVRVWDPLVRLFHWSVVACFVAAWISAENFENFHTQVGYIVAGLVGLRLIWGLIGSRYARFGDFVASPRRVLGHLRDMLRGREARYLGHNPAGGTMVVALILGLGALCFSGWLMFTDTYYGDDRVSELHGLIADGALVLIVLHLGGVAWASLRHRENLVRAMITGNKPLEDPSTADH